MKKKKHIKKKQRFSKTHKNCFQCKEKKARSEFEGLYKRNCKACDALPIRTEKEPLTFYSMAFKALNKSRDHLKALKQPNWVAVLEVHAHGVKSYIQTFGAIDPGSVTTFGEQGTVERVFKYRLSALGRPQDIISVMAIYLNK